MSKPNEDAIDVSEIPPEFIEYDEHGSKLISVINFELRDADGNYIAINDLSEARRAVCTGEALAPFADEWKDRFAAITTSTIAVSPPPEPQYYYIESIRDGIPTSVRFTVASLPVHASVDLYSPATNAWHAATILDINKSLRLVHVHYTNWAEECSEWVEFTSSRIAPSGYYTTQAPTVPYCDYSGLIAKAQDVYGELPMRDRRKVIVTDIVDWCIDYAYCYPSLWVITSNNTWIRLAGALHPTSLTSYTPIFAPTLTLFTACCHFVHILYDVVIRRQKMPLEEILKHLYLRSNGYIREDFVYEHSEFICEQLTALEPMNFEGSKHKIKSYENCPFMAQLKKTAKQYLRSGKKALLVSYHTILSDGTRKTTKQAENHHLFEDKVFWMNEKQRGAKIVPFPVPSSCLLSQSRQLPILYQCYAMLMNYRNMLHIPIFSIKSLERCLMSPQLHPFVAWLHTTLLKVVIKDIDTTIMPFQLSDDPDYKPAQCAQLLHLPSSSEEAVRTLPIPSTGSWLEALRICMLLRIPTDLSESRSYFVDVMGDLHQILLELSKESEYFPLLSAGDDLTINDVIFQLSIGAYDVIAIPLSPAHREASGSLTTSTQCPHTLNAPYDIYHPLLRRWVEAILINIEHSADGAVLEFAMPDWEASFNVKYPEGSTNIAPRDKTPHQRGRSGSITKHFQHGAVVDTIKNIIQGLQSQFSDLCDSFLRQFEAMYEVRIIQAHHKFLPRYESTSNYWLYSDKVKPCSSNMHDWLLNCDYDELSYDQRLALLQWLTDEVVKSSTGRQYLDSVMAYHGDKRKSMEGDMTGIEEVQLRIVPLGCDRDDRTYWHFPCDDHVVIEDGETWRVANREDTVKIMDWLCDKGIHESQLKQVLYNLPFMSAPININGTSSSQENKMTSQDALESDTTPTQKSRKKRRVAGTNVVYDCLDNIEDQWTKMDTEIPLAISRKVQLSAQQTLELGIKEMNNRICATSYVNTNNSTSVAKAAGIQISDQLLVADDEILYRISNLHAALRNSDGTRKRDILVLLLRYANPFCDSLLLKAYESDLQFRAAYDSQIQEEAQQKELKYDNFRCILNDIPVENVRQSVAEFYPSKLFGFILHIMQATRFPYAVPPHWRYVTCASLMTAANNAYHRVSENKPSRVAFKASMIDALLGLESALNDCHRALPNSWTAHRRRYKWILTCRRAMTYAQIAAAAATLHEVIDFGNIHDSALKLDRVSCVKLFPKTLQINLPAVGETVIYYAEGHFASLQTEERLGVPDTCIDADYSTKVKELADERVVYQCVVNSIHYICGGSRDIKSEKCYPFALLELKVVPASVTLRKPVLLPPRDSYKHINRLLLRVLGILMSLPEAQSVIRINDKNYSAVVEYPVSLEFMRGKAHASQYHTLDEFMEDLRVLRENTAYYYKSPAPSERMAIVYTAAEELIEALRPEVLKPPTIDPSVVLANASDIPQNLVLRVSIHLSEGFPEFVVSESKYLAACTKSFVLEDSFQMKFATENGEKTVYHGMIIGAKPQREDGFIPWDWLKVEWDAGGDDHFSEVNPWEIEQITHQQQQKARR